MMVEIGLKEFIEVEYSVIESQCKLSKYKDGAMIRLKGMFLAYIYR